MDTIETEVEIKHCAWPCEARMPVWYQCDAATQTVVPIPRRLSNFQIFGLSAVLGWVYFIGATYAPQYAMEIHIGVLAIAGAVIWSRLGD